MTTHANTAAALQAADNSLQKAFAKQTGPGNTLGKDDFLKLLMAQMTNQNPLDPMDSQGMMDQLTGMGSLEQLININKALGRLDKTQTDIVRANAFAYLDKDVTVRGGGIPVSSGQAPGLQFRLPREAESVHISIVDPSGVMVREFKMGPHGPGSHSVAWDGTDNVGERVTDGFYRYAVSAKAADEEPVPVDLFVRGKVAGVRFEGGRPKLRVNGEDIDVRDIIEMSNRSQRLFGDRLPSNLRQELRARPPAMRGAR